MEIEMIERVARAMCARVEARLSEEGPPPRQTPAWQLLGFATAGAFVDASWGNYSDQAVAALEAMREPTARMLKASPVVGTGPNEDGIWSVNTRPARDVWRAMMGAALPEEAP